MLLFQVYKPVVMSQTNFMFVVQCEIFLTYIFNDMACVIDILNGISLLALILQALTIICVGIGANLPEINEFERDRANSCNININVNDICQTDYGGVGLGFFLTGICFIIQVMDGSSLETAISIEFALFIGVIGQLILNLDENLTFDAIDCETINMQNIFCLLYYILSCFLLCEFAEVVFVIKYKIESIQYNIHDKKQLGYNLVDQLYVILLILILLQAMHQVILLLQDDEPNNVANYFSNCNTMLNFSNISF